MMRRHFARDPDAGFLPFADGAHRLACAHMRHVEMRPGEFREQDAPLGPERFARARNPAQAKRRGVETFVRDAVAFE